MAVQHVPPPRISSTGQTEDESDRQDNRSLNSTVTRQTTVRWPDQAGAPQHLLHHHITTWDQHSSGSPHFGKTTLVSGSHKWRLDFTARTPTRTKTDSTRYLQPSRNQLFLPKYPTAYGIHQHKISQDKYQSFKTQLIACCTDSKERQLHRLLTELKLDKNFCERSVTWHHTAFLKTYYIPFG